jgi:hypothetical protein
MFPGLTPVKMVFKDNNTARDMLRAPQSNRACAACEWAHNGTVPGDDGKDKALRYRNWLFTPDHARQLSRPEFWSVLLALPVPPFLLCYTESYKKHVIPRAVVTFSHSQVYVCGENTNAVANATDIARLGELLLGALPVFSKTDVITGNYFPKRIQEFGTVRWRSFEHEIAHHRGRAIFDVCMWAAPSGGTFDKPEKEASDAAAE